MCISQSGILKFVGRELLCLGSTSGNHLLLRVKQGGRVVWNPNSLPEIEIVTVIFTQNRNSDNNMRGREGAFHKGLP